MNRRKFINQSAIFTVGGLIQPQLPLVLKQSEQVQLYVHILGKIIPIAKRFLLRILKKGVEAYVTNKVDDWLKSVFDSDESKHKTLNQFPESIQNTQIIINGDYTQTQVLFLKNQNTKPTLSLIPVFKIKDLPPEQSLIEQTFTPILNYSKYLGFLNFPEVMALDTITSQWHSENNLGSQAHIYTRKALIPISPNKKTRYSLATDSGRLGSIVYPTSYGKIHILYEVKKDLRVEGEISFYPNPSAHKIESTVASFSGSFSGDD